MAGAMVYLSMREKIGIACTKEMYPSLRSFYVHHPNITVYPNVAITRHVVRPFGRDQIDCDITLPDGFRSDDFISHPDEPQFQKQVIQNGESWVKYFYDRIEVPFSARYDLCPIERASELVDQTPWSPDAALVHDYDPYLISGMPLPPFERVINTGDSILRYGTAINKARELHCINSSVLNLAECFNPMGRLFYHEYAKHHLPPGQNDCALRHSWKRIKVPVQGKSHEELAEIKAS